MAGGRNRHGEKRGLQKDAVRHYCDSIFDSGAESECFFYRLGLKDGIRLWKFMKKLMKTVS